jgi:hypothetical protein
MVFLDKGATTNATELGYLFSKLCRKGGSSIAAKWTVRWRQGMQNSAKDAFTVMSTCKDVPRGSKYYANLLSRPTKKFFLAALANLNPTPPTLMVPFSKKKVRKQGLVTPKKGKKEVVLTLVSVPKAAARKRSTSSTTAAAAPAAPGKRANKITTTPEFYACYDLQGIVSWINTSLQYDYELLSNHNGCQHKLAHKLETNIY